MILKYSKDRRRCREVRAGYHPASGEYRLISWILRQYYWWDALRIARALAIVGVLAAGVLAAALVLGYVQ